MKTKLLICVVAILALISCTKQHTQTTDENIDVVKIYNIVILDRSASMSPLREAAVHGYNGILEVVRNAQEQNAIKQQNYITLSFFNDSVTNVFDCDTIQSIPNLLLDDYRPQGNTALWDAIGISLESLKVRLDSLENATAVVTIISDGLENAYPNTSYIAFDTRTGNLIHFLDIFSEQYDDNEQKMTYDIEFYVSEALLKKVPQHLNAVLERRFFYHYA